MAFCGQGTTHVLALGTQNISSTGLKAGGSPGQGVSELELPFAGSPSPAAFRGAGTFPFEPSRG